MKTLNLVYPEKSEVKFQVSKFPDGQQQVRIVGWQTKLVKEWGMDMVEYPVSIKARLNNFQDLELIICTTMSLRSLGVKNNSWK